MDVDLQNTALIRIMSEFNVQLFKQAELKEPNSPSTMTLGPLRPADEYAVDSFLFAMEVISACDQLRYSVAYLAQFRSTPKLKKSGINRVKHIIYHLENHSIRIRMVFDRILQLINVAFKLGNSKRNCTPQVILQNEYVKVSGVLNPVKEIDQILKHYKPTANVLLHQQGHSEPDLRLSEMVSILKDEPANELPEFAAHAAKREMDQFVVVKHKELLQFNQRLLKAVADVLNELGPECEKKYAELEADHEQQ